MSGKYRILHTSFWNEDPEVYEMTPENKLFYAYLLTGPQTKQCGISIFSTKIAADQTGFNQDTILHFIKHFQDDLDKVRYNPETREIAVKNWVRWNCQGKNPKVEICIEKELKMIKDKELIPYVWGNEIEIPDDPKDEEAKKKKLLQNELIEKIFGHWKEAMKHPGASLSPERVKQIRTRLNDGFTYDQCIEAVNGCAGSSYHMGKNDDGTVYDSIELIFRNASKTEGFINRNRRSKNLVRSIAGKAKNDNYDWDKEEGEKNDGEE